MPTYTFPPATFPATIPNTWTGTWDNKWVPPAPAALPPAVWSALNIPVVEEEPPLPDFDLHVPPAREVAAQGPPEGFRAV